MSLTTVIANCKFGESEAEKLALDIRQRLIDKRPERRNKIHLGAILYWDGMVVGKTDLLLEEGNYLLNFDVQDAYNSQSRKRARMNLKKSELFFNHYFPGKYRFFNIAVFGGPKPKYEWIKK